MLISRDWLIKVIVIKAGGKRNAFCLISVTLTKAFWPFYQDTPKWGDIACRESFRLHA
jgi:hypothetical protein